MRLLDTPVKLSDFQVDGRGFLRGSALIARTGIQRYAAWELQVTDRPPDTVLRIYRPPEAVFDKEAMASFASAPVTDDHPIEDVIPDNVRKLAVGWAGEEVTKDGDHVKTVLTIAGADAIAKVKAGKVELSAGYDSDLEMKDGKTPAGEVYDGIMTNIRGNHIALVDAGRCGGSCRITDGGCRCGRDCKGKASDNGETRMTNRTIVVDGISIETTDQGAQAIDKLAKQIATMTTTHTADIARMTAEAGTVAATHKAAIDAKDGEIAALKLKVVSEDQLDALISARAAVADVAKVVLGDKFDAKGKTTLDIKRLVVASKLGDAEAKDKPEGYIAAAFDVIAKDAKPAARTDGAGRTIESALSDGAVDADKAWQTMVTGQQDAWKNPAGATTKQ